MIQPVHMLKYVQSCFYSNPVLLKMTAGVYILQNTMARGDGAERNENWGNEKQNEKEGKRGKEKEKKDFFC